jgi:hypothetical protein
MSESSEEEDEGEEHVAEVALRCDALMISETQSSRHIRKRWSE